MVPEILCTADEWTDGLADRQKKRHFEVGAPPKKEITKIGWI